MVEDTFLSIRWTEVVRKTELIHKPLSPSSQREMHVVNDPCMTLQITFLPIVRYNKYKKSDFVFSQILFLSDQNKNAQDVKSNFCQFRSSTVNYIYLYEIKTQQKALVVLQNHIALSRGLFVVALTDLQPRCS